MKNDRDNIREIISHMLDNPNEHGIYPTSTCYLRLEQYIESVRMQAIGWAFSDACIMLDKGEDPRLADIADQITRAKHDLSEPI